MAKNLPSTIAKLKYSYKVKQLDPIDVTNQCLNIAEQQKTLNAFIRLTPDIARSKSRESSERFKNGKTIKKLDGVPIAIKDNFCVTGVPASCASRMLENFVPTYDATVYAKLKAEGAVLLGKTNLDEFAMGSGTIDSIYGFTRNNFDETGTYIAGGSSGGSAVAVASGICYAGIGSDTGGSVRNPASYCGIVGLKPTYGLVSRNGLIPLVNSMDTPAILTRTVDDCAVVLNAIAGPDAKDSTTINRTYADIALPNDDEITVKGLKIGIPKEYHCDGLSQEVLETWMKVADLLEVNGAKVIDVSLPHTASSIFVYTILNQCEVASNMARYDGIEYGHRSNEDSSTEELYAKTRQEGFNSVVKNRILSGNYYLLRRNYEKYFEKALKVRRLISNDICNVFYGDAAIDALLTPTTLTDAPKYDEFVKNSNRDQCAVQDFCTQPANMAGVPALSIPIRLSANRLPLSVQLMGPHLSETTLLTIAKWIERTVGFVHLKK